MKALKIVGMTLIGLLAVLGVTYFLGPKAPEPHLNTTLPEISGNLAALEQQIITAEAKVPHIKPDNASRIIWAKEGVREKTPFSLVYLHGFSASQGEGDPIHRDFARRYGMNLYLPRLAEHGVNGENPMMKLSPENLVHSAKEAIAIGQQLGDKVILMSCSTGGTLSLYLASEHPELYALIAYSPNVDLFNSISTLLTGPWGLEIAEMVQGGKYYEFKTQGKRADYWVGRYRIEALVALKSLTEHTMRSEVFEKVKQPFFLGYYYKNDSIQDHVVSIPRMLEMYEQLGTADSLKRKVAFPEAGHHVISSKYTSKDVASVQKATYAFAEEILGLRPVVPPHDAVASLTPALEGASRND